MVRTIGWGSAAIIAVLLILPIAYAQREPFSVKVGPVLNVIPLEGRGVYDITITNFDSSTQEYRIYSLNFPDWDIVTDPVSNPITVVVDPAKSGTVRVYLDPIKVFSEGTYGVPINIKSQKGKSQQISLDVTISSTATAIKGYVPTVILNIKYPDPIDPREPVKIQVRADNQNRLNITDLRIVMTNPVVGAEVSDHLEPLEEKFFEVTKSISPLTPPGELAVTTTGYFGDKAIVTPLVQKVRIIEYAELGKPEIKSGFLKTERHYTFRTNNKENDKPIEVPTSLLETLFSSTNPRAKSVKKDDGRYFQFTPALDEKNEMSIQINRNFRPLVVILVLIMIALGLYYANRSPLTMNKSAAHIKKHEGGISELKVIINVRNRGTRRLEHIEVTDIISNIANIEKDLYIGTLQPTKMHHAKEGSVIKWDIDKLDPSEERVITYKIKSSLAILGDFTLKAAIARFRSNGRDMLSRSNSLSIRA